MATNRATLKLSRELQRLREGDNLSITATCKESDVLKVRAMIVGPPDTPYAFGLFDFSLVFPKEYPMAPPKVQGLTTNYGRTRFNPNIYACGKVCLSILGTWHGESSENWSAVQGLESVLISIQSLMSPNPYENEPGFETARSAHDKKMQQAYVDKIHHETLRISVIERLERCLGIAVPLSKEPQLRGDRITPEVDEDVKSSLKKFDPFVDRCKLLFLWYYDVYRQTIIEAGLNHKPDEKFVGMPFEHHGNDMEGSFQYKALEDRLTNVKNGLDNETKRWAVEGLLAVREEKLVAGRVQGQFDQTKEKLRIKNTVTIDMDLENGNPFVWKMIYYGKPMTHLDGGMFHIKMHVSPRFPEEQPRVTVKPALFHRRITKSGHLCYGFKDSGSLYDHVEAIVAAIEDDAPVYDPRAFVQPEASKLYWGSADDKKLYNRKLRRSVQHSAEYIEEDETPVLAHM